MRVVLINIGGCSYSDYSIPSIKKYYEGNGIRVDILKENHPEIEGSGLHPSWNKLFLHEIYDDDFILYQDLDIIPINSECNIFDFINVNYLNMSIDESIFGKHYLDYSIEFKKGTENFPHFRFNTGLLGFPKSFSKTMQGLFHTYKTNPFDFPSFEQYYINKFVGDNRIFINEIPLRFNTFYKNNLDFEKISFCHFTYNIKSEDKTLIIEQNKKKLL